MSRPLEERVTVALFSRRRGVCCGGMSGWFSSTSPSTSRLWVAAGCDHGGCVGRGLNPPCEHCKSKQTATKDALLKKYKGLEGKNDAIVSNLDGPRVSNKNGGKTADKTGAPSNAAAYFSPLPKVDDPTIWGYEWLHCVADAFNGPFDAKNLFLGTIHSNDRMSNLEKALGSAYDQCQARTVAKATRDKGDVAAAKKIGWKLSCKPLARRDTMPWISDKLQWAVSNPSKVPCFESEVDTLLAQEAKLDHETLVADMLTRCCESLEVMDVE